jgi:acyl-CoA synthetase (AMP-forming)/AMP-acid ligase II
MHPYIHAAERPDHPAMVVADTGEVLSYGELDRASNQAAQLFRRHGLKPGDKVGVMLRNSLEFPIVYWAVQRSGLLATLLSTHLKTDEAAYILNDSQAKLLITSADVGETATSLASGREALIPGVGAVFTTERRPVEGAEPFHAALEAMPAEPIADEVSGFYLIYSSGTTGRPKGIMLPFRPGPIEEPSPVEGGIWMYKGFDPLVSFCAGPHYHGAPLSGMIMTQRLGGTAVTLRKFDALETLKAIRDWRVAHAQFVPTMFVRMLALPDDMRQAFDLGSLKYVSHAAAPCPVEVKRRMIEWLGPIIHEYYGSSENLGGTHISSEEWLRKPGSVGRARVSRLHICDEDGRELAPGEEGLVYFETAPGRQFSYLNDPEKTRRARHPSEPDWFCVGDIGRLDEEGYLFLTDRRDFMIISGGVNIYPQAVENALIVHPKVLDAAVIGVPNPEYGEEVKAIVQPRSWADAGRGLEAELIDWCRSTISPVSCPRSVEFVEELPRLASGKLAKKELRRLYGAPSGPQPSH